MEKERKRGQFKYDSGDINEAELKKENIFSKYKFENPCLKSSITTLSDVILNQPVNEKQISIQDNLTLKKKMNSFKNSEIIGLPCEELNHENSNKLETNASCPESVINLSNKHCYETSDDEDIDFQKCKKRIKLNHLKDADKKEKTPFLCEICKSNLEDLNFEERSSHMNRCIDQQSESGLPAVTESSSSNVVFILECPLCFKSFSTPELRSTHVKKCGKSRGLTVQSVVKALQLQEKHALERKMLGLPLKPMKQTKQQKKPVMKRLIEPKNEQQSDIQLAKALSLSLDEENKKLHRPWEEDINPLTAVLKAPDDSQNPGKRAKKCNRIVKETPILLLRTEEERRKILEEKVATIVNPLNMIENNITEGGDTESSSKTLSNQMQVPLLWNLSSKSEEKTMYYVEQLFDWITPSNIETGCKLFSLSQIPGHHIITQIPHDYSFNNSNTDAVLLEHDQILDSGNSVIDCFQSLVASSYMSDVEIHTASGIVIPAHKLILSVRCPSLKKFLDTSHEKCILNWKDVSFDGALQFLNFIYTGNAEWKDDLIAELTSLANKYSVCDLLRQINSNCGSLKTVAEVGVQSSSRMINVDLKINANDVHSAKEQYRSVPVENNNSPAATNLNIRNENNFSYFEKEDRNLSDCEVIESDKFSQVSNINLEIVNNFIDSSLQPESPTKSELNRCDTAQNDLSETDVISQVSELKSIKEMSENTATCSTSFSPDHCSNKKIGEIDNILLNSEKEQSVKVCNSISNADNLSNDSDDDVAIIGEFSQKSSSQISNVDICERNIMHDSGSALCIQNNSQSVNKTLTQDTFSTKIEEHSTYVSYYQNNIQSQTVIVQSNVLVNDLCKNMNKCTRTLSPNLGSSVINDMNKSFDEFRNLQQQSHDNKTDGIITASSVVDCFFTIKANVSNFPVDNFKNICRSPDKFISSSKSKETTSSPEILISDSDEELPAVLISDSDEDMPVLLDCTRIIENKSMPNADQVIVNKSASEYSPLKDNNSQNFSCIPYNSSMIEHRNNLSPGILITSSDEDGSSDELKGTVPLTGTAADASFKSDNTHQLYARSQVCFNVDNGEPSRKQQICLGVESNELVERNQANDEFSKINENSFLLNDGKSNERNWMCFDSNKTPEKVRICVESENREQNEEVSICHSSDKGTEKEIPSYLDSSSDDSFLPLSQRIRALTKGNSFQDFQASSKQSNDELNGKEQNCFNVGGNEIVERNKVDDEFSKKNENSFVLNDGKSNERNWMCFDSNETHEKGRICVDSENHEQNEEISVCHSSDKEMEEEVPNYHDTSSDDSFLPLSQRIRAAAKEDSFQDFQGSVKQNKVSKIGTHIPNLKSEKSSAVKKLSEKKTQPKNYNEISSSEKKEDSCKLFRYMLEGHQFMGYTDHKPLMFTMQNTGDTYSPRQCQRLEFISQFTSDVIYVDATPVVQDRCVPQFKLSDSPITPLPDYKNMVTPDIKQALKNIGVRALPRRKAVALLSRVYDETHPWAEENCAGGEEKSSHGLPASHQAIAIKQGMQNHKKRQNRKQRSMMKKISEEPSTSLSSNSSEDVLKNRSDLRLNNVLDVCSSQLSDDGQPTSKEDVKLLKEYILSNQELYKKILNYVPINLNDLHEQLKESGIKISNKTLMDYLDEQCIVFTYPRPEEYRKKQQVRSQQFRKRMIAKLSQQGPKNSS